MDVRRLLPLSGVVFVVLLVLAVVVLAGDHPESDAPASEIATFYEENSGQQSLAAFVLAAATPFIVLFALSLPSNPASRFWGRVADIGGAITAAAVAIAALIHFALANGGENGIEPAAAQALSAVDSEVWLPITAGLGVLMLGAAGLILSGNGLPRWIGWVALGLGIALFIPFVSFVALLAALLWVIAVSVLVSSRYASTTVQGSTA